MGQTWDTFNEGASGDTVKQALLDQRTRTDTLQSHFSGTSYPSDTITVIGQYCWRTDTSKMYRLVSKTPDVWAQVPAGIPVPITEGGTGGITAAAARTNLGLGTAAVVNTGTGVGDVPTTSAADARYLNQSSDLSDLASAATARTNLGLGSLAPLSAVGTGQLTDLCVTTAKLALTAVDTGQLADEAVTLAKMDAWSKRPWWPQAKSTTYSASQRTYVIATVGSSWTLTLPWSPVPTDGDRVGVYVKSVTGTSALTIDSNGATIGVGGATEKLFLPGDRLELMYFATDNLWVPTSAFRRPHAATLETSTQNGTGTVNFTSALTNIAGIGDTTTNRITMRRAGTVLVTASANLENKSYDATQQVTLSVRKNGVVVQTGSQITNYHTADAWGNASVSFVVAVADGDYFDCTVVCDAESNTGVSLSVVELPF